MIRTDTRWAGCAVGGYLPVRVEIANQAGARSLVLEAVPSDRSHGVTVTRVVGVDERATVRLTLPIPMTAFQQGVLHVYEQGIELSSHNRVIGNATANAPAMLVVSTRPIDFTAYISAVGASRNQDQFSGFNSNDASAVVEVVPPGSLPDSWIDFSGLDFLTISRDDLEHLKSPVRSAILEWVGCGGNLIVFETGESPGDVEALDRLLSLNEHAAVSPSWTKSRGGESLLRFAKRELMLGLVCKFPDRLPEYSDEWSSLLTAVGAPRFSWAQRHGIVPEFGTEEFYNFMNPNIRGVPVYGFMVLITAFAVLIGPVNYFYLKRKRLLWMLLVTVPVTAFVTSVLLVGYSVAAHGFSIRSRIRSLTVLDQESHQAVTIARMALFAGVAPSRGMQFSQDTAVFPVFPPTSAPGASTLDWTEGQSLTSGWLRSRTRTQFLTIRNSEQKAHIDVKPGPDGGLSINNGFPWEMEAVLVADESGRLLSAANVRPDATVRLADLSEKNRTDFLRLLGRNRPELPDNFTAPVVNPLLGRRFRSFARFTGFPEPHFDSNLMERLIRTWSQDLSSRKTSLAPRTFLAVLRQNPGVDTGVGPTIEQAGYHLLFGYY